MNRAIQAVRTELRRWVFALDGWRMWAIIAFWLAVYMTIAR